MASSGLLRSHLGPTSAISPPYLFVIVLRLFHHSANMRRFFFSLPDRLFQRLRKKEEKEVTICSSVTRLMAPVLQLPFGWILEGLFGFFLEETWNGGGCDRIRNGFSCGRLRRCQSQHLSRLLKRMQIVSRIVSQVMFCKRSHGVLRNRSEVVTIPIGLLAFCLLWHSNNLQATRFWILSSSFGMSSGLFLVRPDGFFRILVDPLLTLALSSGRIPDGPRMWENGNISWNHWPWTFPPPSPSRRKREKIPPSEQS